MTKSEIFRTRYAMLISCLIVINIGSAAPTLKLSEGSGEPGNNATIRLSIENNDSVVAFQVDLNFDPGELTQPRVTPDLALGRHAVDFHEISPGLLRVFIFSDSNELVAREGGLAAVRFLVEPNAPPGLSDVNISNIVMGDIDGNDVFPAMSPMTA